MTGYCAEYPIGVRWFDWYTGMYMGYPYVYCCGGVSGAAWPIETPNIVGVSARVTVAGPLLRHSVWALIISFLFCDYISFG